MSQRSALITVGMPVYNGEKHLRAAIDSILSQTFQEFEIIISDNASTDSTPDICQEYATRDSRVHVVRQPTNIGGARNWSFVASKARGKFFKWASANDICQPQMLGLCVQLLRDQPDCVLAYAETSIIDECGKVTSEYRDQLDATAPDPAQRFRTTMSTLGLSNALSGLIRTESLLRTRLVGNYAGSDLPLIAELALLGKFYRVPQRLFLRRVSPGSSTVGSSRTRIRVFFQLKTSGMMISDSLKKWLDYVRVVSRSGLDLSAIIGLYWYLLKVLYWELPTISEDTIEEFRAWMSRRFFVSNR